MRPCGVSDFRPPGEDAKEWSGVRWIHEEVHLVDMAIIMYRDNHQDPHKYGDYGGPLLAGDVPFISYIVKEYFLFM